MLSVFDSGQKYPIVGYSDFFITHLDGGEDTLSFTAPVDGEIYAHLSEENIVEYGDNQYRIKSIDAPSSYANIECLIDLDFLKSTLHKAYDSGSLTIVELLTSLLPSGWTVQGYLPAIRRTIQMENATPYDILNRAKSTFSVVYEWHTKSKMLTVINPNVTEPSGEYLTDELNLRKIAFKGKSTDLITRLYPYGKDGLSIAAVNGGKEYIDNHQYTGDIICGVWKDERYTDTLSLKTDAEIMLNQLSAPERSYDCDVIDLAKLDSRYSDFAFSMYKVVTLIDRTRHTRMNHKILEYKEYPDEPQKNVLTLASVVKDIKKQLDSALSVVQDEIKQESYSREQAIANLTDIVINGSGLYSTDVVQPNGSVIRYAHNKQLLSESQIIWKFTTEAWAVSTDGGKTYPTGFTMNGDMVARMLSVVGLDAQVVRTGILKAVNGKSEINLDTGLAKIYGILTTASSNGVYTADTSGGGIWIKKDGQNVGWLAGTNHPTDGYITWLKTQRIDATSLDVRSIWIPRTNGTTYPFVLTEDEGAAIWNTKSIVGVDNGINISKIQSFIGTDIGADLAKVKSVSGGTNGMDFHAIKNIYLKYGNGGGGEVQWKQVNLAAGGTTWALCLVN
ncbi:prophage endopeptidase tail family protein [Scatolibacter rhodanostii]|uniref:prophage endopeptidase tail family protein n=1 Tax=Scatolibacter rhodanostii TaxID=2014781 RepID=UPI000C079F9F|nr:prophage endopeptidase tail family protein [Scatolibacter rhodanostii]